MRLILSAVLYTALAIGANAQDAGIAALEALRDGDMKKLVFHGEPVPSSAARFVDADGQEHGLDAYLGRHVVLNFWATWCAPCRKEMPMLSELQSEFGGDDFAVVTVATGRNSVEGIRKFFGEIGVDNLPLYLDPKQQLAREMSILGLPITVILDPEGNEIARLRGDAEWNSPSAKAIVSALIAAES